MPMKNPPHPGKAIKLECLEPLGLTIMEGARILDVARPTLSKVINGKAAISPEMAIRLEKAFGGTARSWIMMQLAHDMAQVQKRAASIKVKRYEPI